MSRRHCYQFLLAICLAAVGLASLEAVPLTLHYQGHIVAGGTAFDGTGKLKFALVNGSTATLWSNDGTSVNGAEPTAFVSLTLRRGVFNVNLGDTGLVNMTALAPEVFASDQLYLRVWFSTNGTSFERLNPDRPINSVAFAMRAGTVDSIPEGMLEERHLPTNFLARITNLTTVVTALSNNVTTISNKLEAPNQTFSPLVSADPQDAELLGKGYQVFYTVPAPAWVNGTAANAPSARYGHAAVWTGLELLVWGGNFSSSTYSSSGAKYDPALDQWQNLSPVNAPVARGGHTAVWTGSEMIVWGGFGQAGQLNTGARYQTGTLAWLPMTLTDAPPAREGHIAAWTGTRMVIWGGQDSSGLFNTGFLYHPGSDLWTSFSVTGTPAARYGATAVWAGDRLLVWGGEGETGPLNSGAQLRFDGSDVPQTWQAMTLTDAPSARSGHSAVWTGSRLVIWGGQQNGTFLGDGAIYNPLDNTWTAMAATGAPAARTGHGAVWADKEMVVLGGENGAGALATSAAYDPILNKWRTLSSAGSPQARTGPAVAWSGSEVVVFGGKANGQAVGALQKLSLQLAWYFYRKP